MSKTSPLEDIMMQVDEYNFNIPGVDRINVSSMPSAPDNTLFTQYDEDFGEGRKSASDFAAHLRLVKEEPMAPFEFTDMKSSASDIGPSRRRMSTPQPMIRNDFTFTQLMGNKPPLHTQLKDLPTNLEAITLDPEMVQRMIRGTSDASHSSASCAEDGDLKADKHRQRNRDHSRKSRLRKKKLVENLKQEVRNETIM